MAQITFKHSAMQTPEAKAIFRKFWASEYVSIEEWQLLKDQKVIRSIPKFVQNGKATSKKNRK